MLSTERPAQSARSAPSTWPLILWSSAVFAMQIGLGRMGYGLALPAIRNTLHGDYTLYGTINALSLGGYLAGALLAAPIVRRYRSVVLVSSIVCGAALVASAFADTSLLFGIARTLFGLASGVSLVAAAVQTLEAVQAPRRGGASAVMWAGIGVGLSLSAICTAWIGDGSLHWRIASFATGVLTATAGIGYGIAVRRVRVMPSPSATVQNERPLLRRFAFLCCSYFSFGFAYIAYATFIVSAIDERLGAASAQTTIAHLWAWYGVTSVVGALAVGRILHLPLGRGAMAYAGLASAAGCAAAFMFSNAAVLSAALVGLGLTATPAAATAFARARSTPSSAPAAIAIVTVAVGLGQLCGPLVSGLAADRFGVGSVALVACCVYLLQALFAGADAIISRA